MTGAGYRNKIAGFGFVVGSLSMVGLPAFAGFVSKLLFAQAAVYNEGKMLPTLIVLGISTILNAIYFLKTVLRIYTPAQTEFPVIKIREQKIYSLVIFLFIAINFFLGLCSVSVTEWIEIGINMFS